MNPAKRLQRLVEDELGSRPQLSTCANIVRDAKASRDPTMSTEEWVASLYLANVERWKASIERREAWRSSPSSSHGSRP